MEEALRHRLQLRYEKLKELVEDTSKVIASGVISEEWLIGVKYELKLNVDKFEAEQQSYLSKCTSPDQELTKEYMRFQMKAEDMTVSLEKIHHVYKASEADNTPRQLYQSRLPKLETPKFEGDITKWTEFWDRFEADIHNKALPDVDKLSYLMSCLKGKAYETVEGIGKTNLNYDIAVGLLKTRFGSSRLVVDAHYSALYSLPKSGPEGSECRRTLNMLEKHIRILQSLGEDIEGSHLRVTLMNKFPDTVIYQVNLQCGTDPSVKSIRNSLDAIITAMESSEPTTSAQPTGTTEALHVRSEVRDNRKRKMPPAKAPSKYHPEKRPTRSCAFCDNNHYSDQCHKFKTYKERKSRLSNKCYLCFRTGHTQTSCRANIKCAHCGLKHNRALCFKLLPKPYKGDTHTDHNKKRDRNVTATGGKAKKLQILSNDIQCNININNSFLQTAVVTINKENCRLLLDSGSQRSYLTTRTATKLGLTPDKEDSLMVYTFGTNKPKEISSPSVKLTITTKRGISREIRVNIVPHIVKGLPIVKIDLPNTVDFLADDDTMGDTVDLLIGNDFYYSFLKEEHIKLRNYVYLVNSDFGWLVSGNISDCKEENTLSVITYCQCHQLTCPYFTEPDLPLRNIDLRFLWSLESIGIVDSPKATCEEQTVQHFNKTTRYNNGRYEVKWPWVVYPPELPTNYGLAYGRLKGLLRRSDPEMLAEYNAILRDQLEAGIIEIVEQETSPSCQTEPPIHYLPHHMVKQNGKKGRLVYDGSAKLKGERSLNECLYSGPSMLEDLTGLLLKFRTRRIGITADIEKAFLQVGLQNEDRDVTRFLWLKDPSKGLTDSNLLTLRFCRVPFGIISSPFLLSATIRYHMALTNQDLLSKIGYKCYVDNMLVSVDDEDKALLLYQETRKVFADMSMNMRDWMSNSSTFLENVPVSQRAEQTEQMKILGLMWNISRDTIKLNVDKITDIQDRDEAITKRAVLSTIARLYDPLGFVTPAILPAKLMFQELCSRKLKWEETLSEELQHKWRTVLDSINTARDVEVPRYVANLVPDGEFDYELHCFCDANMNAFASVVYLRIIGPDMIKTAFLMSKSRITPMEDKEDLKIPRLELLACLIGSRLLKYVKDNLDLKISCQILWTDSKVVLAWMMSNKLLPPFVQRRVNEIKQSKDVERCYINTKANPADIATRPELWIQKQDLWFHGPEFLTKEDKYWPSESPADLHTLCSAGEVPDDPDATVEDGADPDTLLQDGNNEWQLDEEEGIIQFDLPPVDEEDRESVTVIKRLQEKYFSEEVSGKETNLSRNLGVYMDVDGILRCKGRMANTRWPYDMKHPILLPKNSSFTKEIIQKIHTENYHVGVAHTLSILRQNYWVPQGRAQVQKILRVCPQCVKHGGGPYQLPPTPDLPSERVNYSTPFTYVGVDYLGPLYVKTSEGEQKRWICLFTCLAIRAVHLELVRDLTADECLLALRRCIAARGLPKKIVSDNALYFKLVSEVMSAPYCTKNNIEWKFIAQLAPWQGGFYERLVALVKNCLKRTLGKHLLNDHQLLTIVKEIETVVNSRPLTCVGAELEHILKPVDFLSLGQCLTPVPANEVSGRETTTKIDLIGSWRKGCAVLEEFKKMFVGQYLTSLRERYKHSCRQPRVKTTRAPRIGDIVQLKNDSRNRENWKVGKISSLLKSPDGHCRVAKIKVGKTELTRSIGHLYPLEAGEDQIEEHHGCTNGDSLVPPPPPIVDITQDSRDTEPNPVVNKSQDVTVDVGTKDNLDVSSNIPMDIDEPLIQPALEEPTIPDQEVEMVEEWLDSDIEDEAEVENPIARRGAAIRAKQKIAEWTRQLVVLL